MEKAATAAPKILNNYVPIGTKLTGITSGVLSVESGPTIQAAPVPDCTGNVQKIREHIQNLTAFECDDLDSLVSAIIEEYDFETWRTKLIWVIGGIREIVPRVKHMQGSWNFPLRWNGYEGELPAYKVFRKQWQLNDGVITPQLKYEFHDAKVIGNKWLEAEISSSYGLTGLVKKEEGGTGGRFHLLCSKAQAEAYLSQRTNCSWFSPQEAVIVPVQGKRFQSLDLVYVPPKLFVWGIDSDEMYVNL